MGWLIFIGVAVLIAVLLLMPLCIRIRFIDELEITLSYLFFKTRLVPEISENADLNDYSVKKMRKRGFFKKEKKASAKKENKLINFKDHFAKETVKIISETAVYFARRLGKALRIRIRDMKIYVAGEDAAKTALLYGAVSGIISAALNVLYNLCRVKISKNGSVCIRADYCSEKTTYSVDIIMKISLISAITIAAGTLLKLIFGFNKQDKQKESLNNGGKENG